MGTNRVIKTDNEIDIEASNINLEATTDVTGDLNVSSNLDVTGTINSFNLPSADGTDGQIIKTDGSGNLSFIDAPSGGGADVDTIANASDATNYTGTAKFINVTSTADVTFTNDFSDRIINIANNITVTFIIDSLTNCIIKGDTATVVLENPYQPDQDTSGSNTAIYGCDIRAFKVRFHAGGYEANPGTSHFATDIYIYDSTIYSRNATYGVPTFGVNFSTITNFMMWGAYAPRILFYNSLFSNYNGTVLSVVNVYLSEARIYNGRTLNTFSSFNITGHFYDSGGPMLLVFSRTDSSFNNAYGMSTNNSNVQYKFS